MSALFFGPADRQLFGYYHPAAGGGAGAGAAVICPSWGVEYQYSHRALRMLARRLAEKGVHVLRFDYSGIGDSWGDNTDANFERWQHDVAAAVKELQSMSNTTSTDLIGIRIGAHVASAAANTLRDVRRIVLWDPVIDGPAWARQHSPGALHASASAGGAVEFGKQVVSATLLQQLLAIGPKSYSTENVDAALVLQTQGENTASKLAHLGAVDFMNVDDSAPWVEDQSVWSGLVPVKAINTIVEWVTSA